MIVNISQSNKTFRKLSFAKKSAESWLQWKIYLAIATLIRNSARVARWFVFKPKIPIWVNFGGPYAGIFYGHLEYFTVICNISWPFGNIVVIWYRYFPAFWYIVSRKIWQP
jgi:hypothetical protein